MKQEKCDAAVSRSGYVPDESEEDSDSEETRLEELVQRNTRPEPNPAQEERRSKKKHESNNATEGFSGPEYKPPQQPRQLEEETPIQQPQPQPQQQPPKPHQDDIIEISSCSDDEQPPDHMEVLHPLVPKVEELQEDQPPRVVEQPSQTVVKVV
ncbi:hypothetical protein PIB30_049502 [Stylosanthes scabra]|uniref:Uncharacterized protein n=1 Tax=Stylosanthes scabra TaxID=79078 RepID=A0ABU6TH31_9FABA|nr:hypothetical protein [Stylosanthes scabra]